MQPRLQSPPDANRAARGMGEAHAVIRRRGKAAWASRLLSPSYSLKMIPMRPNQNGSFEPAGQSQAAGQLLHLGLGMGGHLLPRVVERSDQQVLENLDLLRIDDRLVELDLLYVALAVQRQLHHAAAGHPGHLDGGELLLHLGHFLLHLLRLLHELADILHASSPVSPPSSNSSSSPSAASAPGSAAARRSRTEAIVAPGKPRGPHEPTGAPPPRSAAGFPALPPASPGSARRRPAIWRQPSASRSTR